MEDEKNIPSYPVTLNFSGEDFSFSSIEKLMEFIDNEKEAWGWLSQVKYPPNQNHSFMTLAECNNR